MPAYFPTISEALNEALDGDVIEIAPGIYSRSSNGEQFPLELRGRRLVLRGAGAWRTILDAGGAARHFRFSEGDSSTLEDAALVGGFANDDGGAIRGDDSFTRIRRVRILNCESREEGNAIAFSRSKATLENVLVTSNGPSGTAVLLEQDLGSRIRRSTFEENGGVALLVRGGRRRSRATCSRGRELLMEWRRRSSFKIRAENARPSVRETSSRNAGEARRS